jgi:hypothetical protein
MRSIYHYRNLSFHFIAHILIYMPFFPCNHAWTICLGFAFLEIDMLGANIFMLVAGFQCWRDRAVSVETCDIFCQIWTRLQLPRLAFFLLWKFKLFSWHRIMFLSGALQGLVPIDVACRLQCGPRSSLFMEEGYHHKTFAARFGHRISDHFYIYLFLVIMDVWSTYMHHD